MTLRLITHASVEQLVTYWNDHLKFNYPMRKSLFKANSILDPNVCKNSSRILLSDGDKVIGMIIAKRWQENLPVKLDKNHAFIQTILVHRDYRNQGIGSGLLNHAEKVFKQKGMTKISLGSDLWHYFPGLPSEYPQLANWFERRGYKREGTVYDLINSYPPSEQLDMPLAKNAKYEILQEKDKNLFLNFFERCFPDRWLYEAMKYFEKVGSGREFIVLKKDHDIKGFCRLNDSKSPFIAQNVYWAPLFSEELGGIGPLGIDPKERGNGYGLGIVEAAIRVLRNRGIQRIVIDWTDLTDFYGKLGYKKWKTYYTYSKTLK